MKKRKILTFIVLILLFLFLTLTSFISTLIKIYSKDLPGLDKLRYFQPVQSTKIYSSEGELIGELFKENRTWVKLEDVPEAVKQSFLASEDSRFYHHHGIDIIGITRAVIINLKGEEIKQGASTITQQLARNIFLTPEVSLERKIKEVILSLKIEKKFTKEEILEFYLNQVYFGAGAYGIQSASNIYFNKDVKTLSLPEAAILAGLPAAPSVYSPFVNFNLAKTRQIQTLERMKRLGFITNEQKEEAVTQSLKLAPPQKLFHHLAYPYFTTYVARQLFNSYNSDLVFRGGLKVYTTLNIKIQKLAESDLVWGVKKGIVEGVGCHQGALVAIEPETGFIRAMAGGLEFKTTDQFNRAWQARRQPGSAFKVFVYTTAIDYGYTPETKVSDSPVSYKVSDKETYTPYNCDLQFWGVMNLQKALQFSRNVVAVKLISELGPERVVEYAYKMGIKEQLEPHLSLALGSAVVTPLEMASAFSVLANKGVRVEPVAIQKVITYDGRVLEDNTNPYQEEVLPESTAYTMVTMMKSVIEAGTGTLANIGRPAGGKTGTTNDFKDSWFIGFTPQLCTAVWVGNDDCSAMDRSYGGYIPAITWAKFMKEALKDMPKKDFEKPKENIKLTIVCQDTRQKATPSCPHTIRIYLSPQEAAKLEICKLHYKKSTIGEGAAKPKSVLKDKSNLENLPLDKEIFIDEPVKEETEEAPPEE